MQKQQKNQYPRRATSPKVQDQTLGVESSNWHSSSRPTPPPIESPNQFIATGTEEISPPQPPLIVTEPRTTNFTPTTRLRLGLITYTSRYFRATRWPVWFWTPLAILFSAVISVLKPAIGGENLFKFAFAVLTLGTVAFAGFVLTRFYEFTLCKARTLPRRPRSRMAKIAYGTCIFSLYLVGLAIIESYAGPQGFLAARVPRLAIIQSRIVGGTHGSPDYRNPTNSNASDGIVARSKARTSPGRTETPRRQPRFANDTSRATATRSHQKWTANNEVDLGSKSVSTPTRRLPPEPVSAWMNNSSTGESRVDVGEKQKFPESSGGYSSRLTPVDLNVTADSVAGGDREIDAGRINTATSSPSQASEIETPLGLDDRSTASKLTYHESQPLLFEPGGTFSEPLIVPLGTKIHGGTKASVQPGGAFQTK